jgi:hypothetical protein
MRRARQRPPNLTQIVREVADEFAARGRPLPVPPDVELDTREANRLDTEFWDEVVRRLLPENRAGPGG